MPFTKQLVVIMSFLGLENSKVAAQSTSIQLDRPDQTECPFIVPANYLQVEAGGTFEQVDNNKSEYSAPSVLWKFGINEKTEIRLITELATENFKSASTTGLLPVTFGFKTNICAEKGIIPIISFIGHLTSSGIGSKEYHTNYLAPAFRFTFQHKLSEKVSLAYNLGAEWDGENAAQTYIYTLTTGLSLSDKLGAYIEIYGFAPYSYKPDHRTDCGFTWLINNNCMADISGGMGLTENAPDFYVSLGFSFRLEVIKKNKQIQN